MEEQNNFEQIKGFELHPERHDKFWVIYRTLCECTGKYIDPKTDLLELNNEDLANRTRNLLVADKVFEAITEVENKYKPSKF